MRGGADLLFLPSRLWWRGVQIKRFLSVSLRPTRCSLLLLPIPGFQQSLRGGRSVNKSEGVRVCQSVKWASVFQHPWMEKILTYTRGVGAIVSVDT